MNNVKDLNLNEIALLVQQIQSHMDDFSRYALGVSIGSRDNYVQLDHIAFLAKFTDFTLNDRDCGEFPFNISSEIGGVTFIAVMDASDIANLETTMPNQFDYITKKLQMDDK